MIEKNLPFDTPRATRLSEARASFLGHLITKCRSYFPISTALDAGTGIGYFAGYLSRNHNLQVVAFDARPSNIEEAKRCYPEVTFVVGNAESDEIVSLGKFDVVTAFGLFYHLENPFLGARNLAQMTKYLLVIESMIAPGRLPQALLLDEYLGDDQSIRYVAFHLTASGLVKLLYKAGMTYVYLPRSKVNHEEFRGGLFRRQVRTIFVASRTPLDDPLFKLIPEPYHMLDRPYYFRAFPRKLLEFALAKGRAIKSAIRRKA